MLGDQVIFVIDPPGSIEKLSHFDVGLGIGHSMRSRRDVQEDLADAYRVIQGYAEAVMEADQAVHIEVGRNRTPGLLRTLGREGKAAVMPFDKVG